MCGRYTITTKVALLAEYFDANVPAEEVKPNYNATPSMVLPVILNTSPRQITMAIWGFEPHWAKKSKFHPQNNARIEGVGERPMFRDAYKKRHCLVLADGFYEWLTEGKTKIPFRIVLDNSKPFAMAGIWEPSADDGGPPSFAILTTHANKVMSSIHDRMPVILKHGKESIWLEEAPSEKFLLNQAEAAELRTYEVSREVNSSKNNGPELIRPISRLATPRQKATKK